MQPIARDRIDDLLLNYKQVIDDPESPARTLELMTNDARVARFSPNGCVHSAFEATLSSTRRRNRMAGDDFALAVVGDTDWAWDLDAILAAVASTWPQADIRDGYPLAGSRFRARIRLPDPQAGRNMEVILHSAEFVTWMLNRFPPPDTARTTIQELLAIGP